MDLSILRQNPQGSQIMACDRLHHETTGSVLQHLPLMYIRRITTDEDDTWWIYPSKEETLKAAKLRPMMDYITKRQEVFHNTYHRFSRSLRSTTSQNDGKCFTTPTSNSPPCLTSPKIGLPPGM